MPRRIRTFNGLLLSLSLLIHVSLFAEIPVVSVGVLVDGDWTGNIPILNEIKAETNTLTAGEFRVEYPAEKFLDGQWDISIIQKNINTLLNDPDVDIIIAAGIFCSHTIAKIENLKKPVIAPFILEPQLQNISIINGVSGKKNLSFVHTPLRVINDIKMFHGIVPFEKLTMITGRIALETIPELSNKIQQFAEREELQIDVLVVDQPVGEILNQIPEKTEAVYLGSLLNLASSEFDELVQGLNAKKIPTFALLGEMAVEKGVLGGLMAKSHFNRLSRRIAIITQRILLGEEPGQIPVAFKADNKLTINMSTARKIGVYPNWSVLTEADLIQSELKDQPVVINWLDAIHTALENNQDYRAAKHTLQAGKENIRIARSAFLPNIEASATGLLVDEDRAAASFGSQAEKTVTGAFTFTQLLFSEPALANHHIQKYVQNSREQEYERVRLDLIAETAVAYLNVLRSKTYERIQKENLKKSAENLELAQVRESVGYSGLADVYRWESQIANNRKTVIEANSQRNLSEMNFNRILNKPLEANFQTIEVTLSDPNIMVSNSRFKRFIDNPWKFKILRNFLVKEGLALSPEIQQLNFLINARERLLKSRKHKYWLPSLALQGDWQRKLMESGAGSNVSAPIPGMTLADDTNWSLALNASFNLFDGGKKYAEHSQTIEELHELRMQRNAAAEKIEQNIRTALHRSGATYAGIRQSELSSLAANKNFELVKDAYSRGAVSIIELIDAQNAALISDQALNDAVYNFLIDYMNLERAIGKYSFMKTENEKQDFLRRLEEFHQSVQN